MHPGALPFGGTTGDDRVGRELEQAERRPGLVVSPPPSLTAARFLARRSAERFGAEVAVPRALAMVELQDPPRAAAALRGFLDELADGSTDCSSRRVSGRDE